MEYLVTCKDALDRIFACGDGKARKTAICGGACEVGDSLRWDSRPHYLQWTLGSYRDAIRTYRYSKVGRKSA